MFKRFKDIKTIRFPVYALPSTDWYMQDGVLFIDSGKVLDDRNMPGNTFGIRRIQSGRQDLCKLKRGYTDFHSMLVSKKKAFIDSNGVPFVYKRTVNSPLIHHMIKKIEPKGDCTLLWFNSINHPMTIPRPPYGDARYARILYYKGFPWMIYDLVSERGKDSYRRV